MVRQARPVLTLTTGSHTGVVPAEACPEVLLEQLGDGQCELLEAEPGEADRLAYVMFTSGSTGVPKGIAVTHRNVADFALDQAWNTGSERVLLRSPHTFDAATYELWVPLTHGGTVVVAPPGELDTQVLGGLLSGER